MALAACASEQFDAALITVLAIWREVLERANNQLDADGNFFLHGGDSLQMLRVLNRVREQLNVDLPLQDVVRFSTPRKMAAFCTAAQKRLEDSRAVLPCRYDSLRGKWPEAFPASAGQTALWLAEQYADGCGLYNTTAVLHFSGALQVPVLERALTALLRRHEILRGCLRFDATAKILLMHIMPEAPLVLAPILLDEQNAVAQLRTLAAQPFDLATTPLWRFHLLQSGPASWALLLCIHHCITDGWSGAVLLQDMARAYNALMQDPHWLLPSIDRQFRDWCLSQQPAAQSDLIWWGSALAGADRVQTWPDTGEQRWPYAMACEELALPAEALARVQHAAQDTGIEVSAVLLAALRLAIVNVTGVGELCIGMPVNVRTTSAQERSIGYFVNLLVLRDRVDPDEAAHATLQRSQCKLREALVHRAVPFATLVRVLQPALLPSGNPWFDLLFAVQNLPQSLPAFSGLDVRIETLTQPYGQHPLKIECSRQGTGWVCKAEYAHKVLSRADILRLLRGMREQCVQLADALAASVAAQT